MHWSIHLTAQELARAGMARERDDCDDDDMMIMMMMFLLFTGGRTL